MSGIQFTEIEPGKWLTTIEDAGDGSGDAIVPIPDEVLEGLGWDEDTELMMTVIGNGNIEIRAAD